MKHFLLTNLSLRQILSSSSAHSSPSFQMRSVVGLQLVLPTYRFPMSSFCIIPHFHITTLRTSLFSLSPSSKYAVFLNFRGKDTRCNFVHPSHESLCLEGINAFKDNINLNKGDRIRQELFHVIKECRIAVPILSKDYATSTWCLEEPVHIMKCKKKISLTIFLVFYDVCPSNVRHLKGSFTQAFAKHEIKHKDDPKKLRMWKQALSNVVEISGFDILNDIYKRDHSKCIHYIVEEVRKRLEAIRREELKSIALVEYHLTRLNSLLRMESSEDDDVLFVGIWGTNNNTTLLMKTISNKFSEHFESICLVQANNLRKQGMVPLQKKLLEKVNGKHNVNVMNVIQGMRMIKQKLCLKKALVILDGVNTLHQLSALAGLRDWL